MKEMKIEVKGKDINGTQVNEIAGKGKEAKQKNPSLAKHNLIRGLNHLRKIEENTDNLMSYMWQELRGDPTYMIQTEDPAIKNKLKRRKNFELIAYGVNCNFWKFGTSFSRPDIAKKTFVKIVRGEIYYSVEKDIYYGVTYSSDRKK